MDTGAALQASTLKADAHKKDLVDPSDVGKLNRYRKRSEVRGKFVCILFVISTSGYR